MKTCLHRLLPTAILSLSSLAQPLSAQTMYDKSQFVDQVDVKISQPYTPFGNRLEFNRYGDDGSKCVLDANGVLTWIGNKGEVRLLPDSSKAIPLFVTNTECLVWVNRFVDYNTYPDRPDAQLRLYRSTPESNEVTSQDVSFQGKEIIATPQVTTTTGTLTFVSATRKDNGIETAPGTTDGQNYSDDCELRFYRLTFDSGVQFVGSKTVQIKYAESFDTNTNGPEIEALGYGSDGSMAIKVIDERVQLKFKDNDPQKELDYEDRTYWVDNQGRFLRVVESQATLTVDLTATPPKTQLTVDPKPCSRVLFVSNTRLVYEHSTAAGVTGIQEQRRSSSTGNLLTSSIKPLGLTTATEAVLDIWNYSQVGVNRYFYTVNTSDEVAGAPDDTGTIIRTYRITSNGISEVAKSTLTGGLTITPATMTGTVNTNDGSALLVTEDGDALIWLHAAGYTALPNSSQASALFVDKDQAVIWENAKAPVGGNGQIPNAIVKHYKQVGTVATTIRTDGNKTLLNTSRLTPDPEYWFFTTAIKTDASTSRLTTYKLGTVEIANVDTDNDGLLDYYETNTGTFVSATNTGTDPSKADSDSDGLNDGSEVTNYKTNPTDDDSDNDTLKDGAEVLTYFTNPLLADTDGDSLSDSAELNIHNTDPLKKDTDGDALEDDDEISLGTDPRDTDSDNDNLTDGDEVSRGTNPKSKDTDGDTLDDDKEVLVHKTNPLKTDSDGDLISDFDEVAKGSNPNDKKDPKNIDTDKDGLTNFDELFVHNTNPNKADTDGDGINDDVEITNGGNPRNANTDTDGDGLKDKVETRTGIFVSATNTGTDPYNTDTDADGLSDKKETGTKKYVSLNNTGTNPNIADTDGDGLSDKQEIDGVNGFKPDPFIIDSDGDLVSDADEVNAAPPTDPKDPSKYPTGSGSGITPLASLHALPVPLGDAQQVSIDESYAPYGHRPDRDKIGDDGSSTIVDRNGVLIWTNREGKAVTIPNATYAKTLHVSNTECLVYTNRFNEGWNSQSHTAQIAMYRRGATGGIISNTPLTINGTVLDTASVTPTTYGYLLVSGNRVDDGLESTQVTKETEGGNPPVTREIVKKVDEWDSLDLFLNVITWDGFVRKLSGGRFSIPKNAGTNFTDGLTLGYGSDGSLLINMTTALEFLDRYDDFVPGDFLSETSSIWVSATINKETVRELPTAIDTLAYLDNDRLIGQRDKNGSTSIKEIVDYRQFSNGVATEVSALELSAGEQVLPLSENSLRGLSPYIYTLDAAGTSLRLYRADATITALGTAVTLPVAIQKTAAFVRNPRDGSLLVKAEYGVIWVPTTKGSAQAVTGLGTPKAIPDSAQGKLLFVTSNECVVWLNGDEPPLNGVLPPAMISHFQLDGSKLLTTSLTPPIEGSYVVPSNELSPDPDLEGWFITTFEKDAPESALIRNYQLQLAVGADRDDDGISDYDELTGRFNSGVSTDPMDPDTDDDGLTDGRELLPFAVVSASLGWEEARQAAIAAGGRLAVLAGNQQQIRFATWLATNKPAGSYWVGGHDMIKEASGTGGGKYQWLKRDGKLDGPEIGDPKNWAFGQPSNLDDADGMQISSGKDYKWSMAPISNKLSYIIEFERSNPVESSLDSDKDGIRDEDEIKLHGTKPFLADSDFDGLSDKEELFPVGTTPATNPLNSDSDGDGYSDYSEVRASKASDPNNALSMPSGFAPTGSHNRIQQSFSPSEISVLPAWTPVLQRTDQTKFGDDGSAAYADANGLLLWRNKDGVVRVIPNSSKAIPLLVSNQKVIVWHNAFNNLLDNPPGNGAGIDPIEIYLYRATSNGGAELDQVVSDAAKQKISGLNVIATAPITTTSQAYHLVTTDPDTTYLYRLSFTGDVQAVSTIASPDDREPHRAYGFGSDGSYVGGVPLLETYWIRATVPGISSGVWEALSGSIDEPGAPRRMIYTSNTRVVYEEESSLSEGMNIFSASRLDDVVSITAFNHGLAVGQSIVIKDVDIPNVFNPNDINGTFVVTKVISKDQFEYNLGFEPSLRRQAYDISKAKLIRPGIKSYNLIEQRRNQFTGFGADYDITTGERGITPTDLDFYRVLQISTQTVEGDIRWVYALNKAQNEIIVYRLTNLALVPVYRATLPEGTQLDEYATVEKINPVDGSAVITSENIDNIVWIHNSNAGDSTKNTLLIPNSRLAKGMFVSGTQLVTWHNAYDGTDGPSTNGMLNKAAVRHYRQANGSFVKQPGGASHTDLSGSIQGTFVLATPIFSPATKEWNFWTIDKPTQTATKAMMRNYKLSDNANNDSDGDGLFDITEKTLGTNSNLADTDKDGLSDYDELKVYLSDPLKADSDGDDLRDDTELQVLLGSKADLSKDFLALDTPSPVFTGANGANGNYEGLLYSEQLGFVGKITVNVATNRSFTGSYTDMDGANAVLTGSLRPNGSLNIIQATPSSGLSNIEMALQKQSNGRYHLHVQLTKSGDTLYSKARPPIVATGKSRKLTIIGEALPNEEDSTRPFVGTATLSRNNDLNGQFYLPDGSRAAYSGKLLDGNVAALYAANSSAPSDPVLMGNVKVTSNLSGMTRLITNDYDLVRQVSGGFYVAPTNGLPLSGFSGGSKTLFNWSDGELAGAYQVLTWSASGFTPPGTDYDSIKSTFNRGSGLLKVEYTRSDKNRNLYQAKSTAYAVVNQRKNTVNGFYSRLNWEGGSFSVNPNSLKLTPPPIEPPPGPIEIPGSVTSISPASKSVGTDAATYNIKVTGVDNWKVSIDESPSWVSAEVVNDDKSQWADKLTGRDNATVKITLLANNDIEARTATINIGGKDHELTQTSGAASKITPPSKIAVKKGESYTIRVEAQGLWKAIPSVNWLIVKVANDNQYVDATSPNSTGSGNATITVQVQPNLTGRPRLDGVINIGGLEHTVNQNSY